MMNEWTEELPCEEGWYFWCRKGATGPGSDPFYWEVYFIVPWIDPRWAPDPMDPDDDADEAFVETVCMQDGTRVTTPDEGSGYWSKIDTHTVDGKVVNDE